MSAPTDSELLDRWAKWIVRRGPDLPDHACKECAPHSDMVKDGFQCIYHQALARIWRKS